MTEQGIIIIILFIIVWLVSSSFLSAVQQHLHSAPKCNRQERIWGNRHIPRRSSLAAPPIRSRRWMNVGRLLLAPYTYITYTYLPTDHKGIPIECSAHPQPEISTLRTGS